MTRESEQPRIAAKGAWLALRSSRFSANLFTFGKFVVDEALVAGHQSSQHPLWCNAGWYRRCSSAPLGKRWRLSCYPTGQKGARLNAYGHGMSIHS